MRKCWNKLLAITVVSLTISLAGLVMSGMALAQQCVDNKNGTVTDNSTGLMWQQATAGAMIWDNAMIYASDLTLGGHSDWRLPSKDELLGLYHSSCKEMMHLEKNYVPYWSATFMYSGFMATVVSLDNGDVFDDEFFMRYYVRAVRAAQ